MRSQLSALGEVLCVPLQRLAGFAGLVLIACLSAPGQATAGEADLYGRLQAASLEVLVDGRLGGSGCFVTSAGLALTAAHTIKGARRLELLTPERGRLDARVVATDVGHDLALLSVERTGGPFPVLEFASSPPAVGTALRLFGSALNRHGLLLPGVVAAARSQFEWNGVNRCYTEVHTLAAMTPEGLSGAPWVDGDGKLVGVQSGMVAKQGSLVGIAFMSPLEAARRLVTTRQEAATPTLGAQFAEPWEWSPDSSGKAARYAEGLYVIDTVPGGPLAVAMVRQGELIAALNGVRMSHRDQLLAALRKLAPGDSVTLSVIAASGARRELSVTLADNRNL